MSGTHDQYTLTTHIDQLRDRAQRRVLVGGAVATALAAVCLVVGLAVGDRGVARSVAPILALLVVACGAGAISARVSQSSRPGPALGLPFAQRRRVVQGLLRGHLDDDPLLHEVQLVEVGRVHDQRKNVWVLPVLAVCWWVIAATGTTPRPFAILCAVVFTLAAIRTVGRLRGAKRILAQT